jgi:Cu-processing system ATP-binding protein
MTSLLEISGITKSFGSHLAVDNLSLNVKAGECLALVGHNGAGKTTLFKMILGLLHSTSGSISIEGQLPGEHAKIGFLPEAVSFHRTLTGRELLAFFAKLRGVEADIDGLLTRVDLLDAGGNQVATYSKGMRQRLGLAQALIGTPRLLILDEPTTGLDPASRRNFYTMLDELRKDGTTILLSSHALTEVEAYTSQVAIMKDGKLLAHGPLQDLARQAALPVRLDVALAKGADIGVIEKVTGATVIKSNEPGWVSIQTTDDQKMVLLNRLTGLTGLVNDVRITPPTLDDIYAYFQNPIENEFENEKRRAAE